MKDRIREVREYFGLSMEKFGSRIGIGKSSVSLLESGKNNPSVQTISLICREFGVNEHWLRTGEGEMFEQTRETALDQLALEYGLSPDQLAVIEGFLDLTPPERDTVLKYLHNVFERSTAPQRTAEVPAEIAASVAGSAEFKALLEKSDPVADGSSISAG